ncbi:tigger transposable element-derived protein 6 [Trichonephila clavipes]|nr:tigger transposable element-derived protein 6 [Trichonephila clavipes]
MFSFKKYKCLTIYEKQKVIESVKEGERKVDVAKAFEIPLSSLSTILKNKEKTLSASSSRVRKRVSKGNFPRLEQCLVSWMRQCREQNIPMGGSLLKEKAKAFAKELGIDFLASEGWLTNFKKRNEIVFKKMCGESSSVDFNVCSKWQNSLSDLIKKYEPRNIFNTDETGLCFKCLPEKTFTFKKEKFHGRKHRKEKLTIFLAVNMDDSETIIPLVIGKSANPRCFKGINSFPTKYRSNKKEWMTTELFNECQALPSPNLVDVDNTLTEFNAEPSVWEALPEQDLKFDDYMLVDTDIAVWRAQSDAEIVALDHNNTESDEDESEELTPITLSGV